MSKPIRALLVEDSEDDALLLVRELRRGGYDVSYNRVDSPVAMRTALDEGTWDIVLSDYSMPGFSGTEALSLLRSRNIDIPFVFVSGTIGEDVAVKALQAGAQDYVLKGKLARLLSAVERSLREAEARREQRRLEARVGQLQRFEAIGRLAGGIAHDFNNVLGAILGWADLGLLEMPEESRGRERLVKIRRQAERAAALTRQLLAFARRQVLEPHNVNVNALVTETVGLMEKVIGVNVHVELRLAAELAPAWADPGQIEQILMNLCINARDAMPEGGRLIISTDVAELEAGADEQRSYFRPGRYVLLSVADTGTGMDAATLEHIFEPFFTTKEVGKGTGLGLATVYGIVKQHDGMIEVDSEPGRGTRFRVYLPQGKGVADAREKTPETTVCGGSETILVAEDNDDLREAAREIIEGLGYRVLLARDGEEAVRLFAENSTAVDLLVMDVTMPRKGGPAALTEMSALNPGVPVIFTTGYAKDGESLASIGGPRVEILQKPYGSSTLAQKIRALLHGSA